MSRKITITVNSKHLNEVLSSLELEDDYSNALFTLEVQLKDSKENYRYLSNSDKIVDWSFIDNNEKDFNSEITELTDKKDDKNESDLDNIVNTFFNIKSFPIKDIKNLYRFIMIVYKSIIDYPESDFSEEFFDKIVTYNYLNSLSFNKNDIEESKEYNLMKGFYSNSTEIRPSEFKYVIKELKKHWKEIIKLDSPDKVFNILFLQKL